MRLYSYVVRYDIGFAPNSFHGWCTLATCKPGIRRGARPGDWVAGIGSQTKNIGDRLVYAMHVEERVTFDQYWDDPRFQRKKPDMRGSVKYRYGDNIYRRDPAGEWQQSDSRHSLDSGEPNLAHVVRDTSANAVLISTRFTYWGQHGPVVPPELRDLCGHDLCRPGRSYTWKPYSPAMREAFVNWVDSLPSGRQFDPADWP